MKIYTYIHFEWNGQEYVELSSNFYEYKGAIQRVKGDGGEIGYPAYMEVLHRQMLDQTGTDTVTYSVFDVLNAAHGANGNPYESETAFNPNTALTITSDSPLFRMNEQYSAAKTIIDAIVPSTNWEAFITSVNAKWTDIDFLADLDTAIAGLLTAVESALSSSSITDMVTAFENNKKVRFLRDQGIWAGGMADINAVHTSSFIMGLAVQQIEFSNSIDQYERELKGNIYGRIVTEAIGVHIKTKGLFLMQGAAAQQGLTQFKDTLVLDLARVKADVEKMSIIALKERDEHDLAIDVDEASWDMEAYLFTGNMLGSISASATGRKPMTATKGQTALGGAFQGASIGSTFGPKGAAVGAGAGALLGWALG